MAAAVEHRAVEVDGVRTTYVEAGTGPHVLLLHGAGPAVSGAGAWRLLIPHLAARFHVVAPDMLGFGGTQPRLPRPVGRRRWTDHVARFADTIDLGRFSVVAQSVGGAVALTLAAEHPQQVRRLVLVSSMGIDMPLTAALDRSWGYEPDRDRMRALLTSLAYDESLVTDALVEGRLEATSDPVLRAGYEALFPAPRQRGLDDLALPREQLRAIAAPTLLIHGLDDPVVRLQDSSARLLEALPDARMHVFPRCKHWPMVEHEAAFSDLVRDFLPDP